MLNVLIINGGRGAGTIIPALLDHSGLHVTSVVNAYDDGKSTGEIRRFFGMLGPSDIRKVQELMLPAGETDHDANLHVFGFRFPAGCSRETALAALEAFASGASEDLVGATIQDRNVRAALARFVREFLSGLAIIEKVTGDEFGFSDCSVMNCIYAGAFLAFDRNIEFAAAYIDRLFKLRGTVLPTSIEDKKLVALRENGQMLYNEAEIVELRSNVRVDRIYLLDDYPERARFDPLSVEEKRRYLDMHHCFVAVSPRVRLALQQADLIIYSAGTQHSSLYPTYLSAGLAEAIADNRTAFKAFVTNIGADYETPSYLASDYLRGAYRYLNLADDRDYAPGELFDAVLINVSRLKADETYVEYDEDGYDGFAVERVIDQFESAAAPGRHDGVKIVRTILDLYDKTVFRATQ